MNDGSEARSVSPVNDISVSDCVGSFTSEFLGTHLLVAHIEFIQERVIVVAVKVSSIIMTKL